MTVSGMSATEALAELHRFQARLLRARGRLKSFEHEQPGATPREAVDRIGTATLYRYRNAGIAAARAAEREPLLIVYALVNRPDMIDLKAGRSMVEGLLERGHDVYLLDWGWPRNGDVALGLEDYADRMIGEAVDSIGRRTGRSAVNLLGICQGGTFALCFAALNPDRVARLVLTVTPVDFQTEDDLLSRLVRHVDLDALVDAWGDIDGDMLNALFLSLKPHYLMRQKYLDLVDSAEDPDSVSTFMRMEHWIFHSPMLPGRICREFGQAFYQRNALVKGTLQVSGQVVRPAAFRGPILNVFATRDHLVPPAASQALATLVPAPQYAERALRGGHIGIYVRSSGSDGLPAVVTDWMQE